MRVSELQGDLMRARLRPIAAWLRRSPWVAAFIALGIGGVLAIPVATQTGFYSALVATYIGAALGFLVAIYIDRLQRAEDEATRRSLQKAAEDRDRDREAEASRARRVAVLSLLRTELGGIPGQMGTAERQARNYAPNDLLTDILWRSFSASGELRWIEDLDLLQQIASAYDLLAVEIDLEKRWLEARAVAGSGRVVSEDFIANQLKLHDHDLWRLACQACKAMDVALVADGSDAGGDLRCPY
jgi:hypothetical protein